MYSNCSSVAGSIAVRADTVNDEEEVGINSNSCVRIGSALSVKSGHSLDSAFAKAFDVPGTNTTKIPGKMEFLHSNEPSCYH